MIRSNSRRRTAALLCLPLLLITAGALLSAPGEVTVPGPEATFAGAATCRECHPEIVESWEETGHARTFRRARPEDLPREMRIGGEVVHAPGRSRFHVRDGEPRVETVGDAGRIEDFPLSDVVGVRRVLMFLTRLADGRRQVLPAMQEATTGEWFDYSHLIFGPGADPDVPPTIRPGEPSFWTGMQRFYDARCARCHTSGWKWQGAEGDGDWSAWRARGIDCESCHGPAAGHAAYQNGDSPPEVTDDPILRYGELPRDRAVGVCLQCHMEAEVVTHGFRPGDDFFEFFDPTLLDDTLRVDETGRPLELIYDGLPFLASECARAGNLTCADCHDPHGGPHRSQTRADSRSTGLCIECHEEMVAEGRAHSRHDPKGPGGGCVACHMPFLTIERGHGVVTDHTMGVPHPEREPGRKARDACTACHSRARGAPGGAPVLTTDQVVSAYEKWWPERTRRPAWAQAIAAGRRGEPGAAPELLRLASDAGVPRIVRASAARLLARTPGAPADQVLDLVRARDSLVRRSAAAALSAFGGETADAVLQGALFDVSEAVRHRAVIAALTGWDRVRRSRSLLEAVQIALEERVEAVPEDDEAWFRLGAARQIGGDLEGAVRAYEQKLVLDPYAALVRRTVERLKAEIQDRDR